MEVKIFFEDSDYTKKVSLEAARLEAARGVKSLYNPLFEFPDGTQTNAEGFFGYWKQRILCGNSIPTDEGDFYPLDPNKPAPKNNYHWDLLVSLISEYGMADDCHGPKFKFGVTGPYNPEEWVLSRLTWGHDSNGSMTLSVNKKTLEIKILDSEPAFHSNYF